MRVFLYEYLTGGGTLSGCLGGAPSGSLLAEGTAMVRALAADFAVLPNLQVDLLRDARLPGELFAGLPARAVHDAASERAAFCELAAEADATILIAPESDGILLERCSWAELSDARLLGPASAFVEIATDKQATAEVLHAAGIPVPEACSLSVGNSLPADFAYPAVLKPRDGVGSMDTRYVADFRAASRLGTVSRAMRLERFHAGIPASVSVLCGPGRRIALPACRQTISDDGRFRYLGGMLPVTAELNARAQALALRALESLPTASGYVGIDLILGLDPRGSEDVVLEVNPRVTTSYVGLRALCQGNLAETMLVAARGERIELAWFDKTVIFTADGRVRIEDGPFPGGVAA
ncbi:MAG: ATP-grasp domain-containing protein [Pirellulaceae bacterium]|nr:ATP-grasp domain-containing protein [Pirellulaceae bacterium]